MNRKAELQRLSEEILIQKIASDDFDIIKQAGLFQELGFGEIASSIQNLVKKHVLQGDESPQGYLDALGNVLLGGTLFKISPVLGIAYAIAKAMGVDIAGIASGIFNSVKEALSNGQTLSEESFNSIAKNAARKEELVKIAQYRRYRSNTPDIPWYVSKKKYPGASLIQRIFGNLFARGRARRASWLAKGIVIWVFKTALLGLGLLTATGAAAGLAKKFLQPEAVSETKPTESKSEESKTTEPNIDLELEKEIYTKPAGKTIPSQTLISSGAGEKEFKNDHQGSFWMVPLAGTARDTLIAWTAEIYPDLFKLFEYDYIEKRISSSAAFKKVLSQLNSSAKVSFNMLIMPKEFTSRKQVVDQFIHSATKGLL